MITMLRLLNVLVIGAGHTQVPLRRPLARRARAFVLRAWRREESPSLPYRANSLLPFTSYPLKRLGLLDGSPIGVQ